MLHIHNGDASANVLRESGLPGDHLPWREALVAGPAPAGLSREEWCRVRAGHLAEAYGAGREECLYELLAQEKMLDDAPAAGEIVLWFEHDLFCQTLMIYLLDRLGAMNLADDAVSLVCIDRFPGVPNFRGLGDLAPEQMASLFADRMPMTRSRFDLASRAWSAYTSPDPTAVENILAGDTSELPFLAPALRAHLRRFPSTCNGLGAVQNRALELIGGGTHGFSSLFKQLGLAEPAYGYGDYQLWNELSSLAAMRSPLVTMQGADGPGHPLSSGSFGRSSFRLTAMGERVMSGQEDALALGSIDHWLGGVHLAGSPRWRWDQAQGELVSIR